MITHPEVPQHIFTKKAEERVIKKTLELIILSIAKNEHITGYLVVIYMRRKFDVWLSSGTVYSTINYLETNGLLNSKWHHRKKYYKITPRGEIYLKRMLKKINDIKMFIDGMTSDA